MDHATTSTIQTRKTVRAYHDAWTGGNVAAARAYLADAFAFRGAIGSYDNPGDHLASLGKFRQLVTGLDLISELYGDDEATLVYDVHTATPVGSIRTAEHFRLSDGRISSIILIFDASGWREFRASRPQ